MTSSPHIRRLSLASVRPRNTIADSSRLFHPHRSPYELLPSPPASSSLSPPASPVLQPKQRTVKPDLPPTRKARVARCQNYIPEEETTRIDYSQRYADGGWWPQNWALQCVSYTLGTIAAGAYRFVSDGSADNVFACSHKATLSWVSASVNQPASLSICRVFEVKATSISCRTIFRPPKVAVLNR